MMSVLDDLHCLPPYSLLCLFPPAGSVDRDTNQLSNILEKETQKNRRRNELF